MPATPRHRLLFAIARAIVVSFLITLLAFAVSLFLAIVGIVLVAVIRGGGVDMTYAYRHVALPVAVVVLFITLVLTLINEFRELRRQRAASRDHLRAA